MNIHGYKLKMKGMRINIKKTEKELNEECRKRRKDYDYIDFLRKKLIHTDIQLNKTRNIVKQMKKARIKKIGK